MRGEVSIDELAQYSGEQGDELRSWQRDGLLPGDALTVRDVERVRLIRALERRGLSDQVIAAALRDHHEVIESFLDEFGVPDATEVVSAAGRLVDIGLDPGMLERVVQAGSFEDVLRLPTRDDIVALTTVRLALEGGFPSEALLQLLRVYTDASRRIADAEVRLFHMHVHQALRSQGLRGPELAAATNAAGHDMQGLIEPTLLYFHRKAWTEALRDDLVIHVLEELGVGEPDGAEGRLWRTVVFVDLSYFTPLTDVMGDATAATILDRFSALVRTATRASSGSVVKQIGDGFMMVFLNPGAAVTATLELHRQLCEQPQFPAMHAGVHHGPVLYREGDYIGGTVNLAARLLGEAGPNEIVLSDTARREAGALANATFHPIGTRSVKGVTQPVELFTASATDRDGPRRRTDPVCGMQLRDDEVAARTTIGVEEHVFCSTACMGLFVARRTLVSTETRQPIGPNDA